MTDFQPKEVTISVKSSREFQTCSRSMTFDIPEGMELNEWSEYIEDYREVMQNQVERDLDKLLLKQQGR